MIENVINVAVVRRNFKSVKTSLNGRRDPVRAVDRHLSDPQTRPVVFRLRVQKIRAVGRNTRSAHYSAARRHSRDTRIFDRKLRLGGF